MDDSKTQSPYLDSLLKSLSEARINRVRGSGEPIEVSDTVSFLAFLYEKLRNAVEFSEEHLIRRIAITRILKRRLSIKPTGESEGENLIRELLWGRYIKRDYGTTIQAQQAQKIIDTYLKLQDKIHHEGQVKSKQSIFSFIVELLSCEIEEVLYPVETQTQSAYLFFLYQELKNRVKIEGVEFQIKDTYFYAACEAAYAKNDRQFIRYHLFTLQYSKLIDTDENQLAVISKNFRRIFQHIESIIKNPYHERLVRYVKKQLPPFLIFYHLLDKRKNDSLALLIKQAELEQEVQRECSLRYQQTGEKLKMAGIRSIIYIFLTKMLFVLLLEIPLTKYFYGQIHYASIAINTLFPPALMAAIITFVNPPSNRNTRKIYARILDIIDYDPKKDDVVSFVISKKSKVKRPLMYAIFTVLYSVLFWGIFSIIFFALDYVDFNLISKGIFIFFLTVVTFFGYRIRQIAKEYALETERNILSPIVEVIFLPILSVGKIFSRELSKINLLMFVFDAIIETPLKLIFEVIEEWFKFTRKQKEEIL